MKYGRIITKERLKYYEVADNVFAAISPNRGLSWANAGFINKGKGLVYDTFFDLPHARELKRFCVEMGGRAPTYVVCSHYNADHTWGNQEFSDSVIIMHKNAVREHFSEDPKAWDSIIREGQNGGPGEQWIHNELKGFDLTGVRWQDPDILIEANTKIMLNDMEVDVISVAPSHSDSDLLLWLPKEKVVFCGDVVFGGAIAYSAKGIKLWTGALDFIINELKPEVVIPGHGAICGLDFVKECKDYFETVMSEFEKHYDEESSALEIAKRCDISRFLHLLEPYRLFINILALTNDRRGVPTKPDWNYFAEEMAKLKEFQDQKYGVQSWDPMSSWAE
ncbi:MBL fold metallo-hydrolase [Papillibacter cinnamivorans]|uniref:Glyoxylase, beta-lactamase superfamily II n=1 Tax=Papillibacter cinnamivorans DSM 12816 TaxID=1122930 RepID=A0A1W2AIJ7_9FIRM|nr:MBL fold metallo-hydrolase [Papillibacter cinnamivorans]SMC60342.1 Glyoxylase, beta-lactamase superfamily II [Papillibacter cinnamivorans DSM 12816]